MLAALAAPLWWLLQASRGQPPRAAPMRSVLLRCVGVRTSTTCAQGRLPDGVLRCALVPAWSRSGAGPARHRQPVPDASYA